MGTRNLKSRERGQAQVEFILSALFLMTMIFAAVQLILYLYTYVVLAQAAKEGVRYAVVHGARNASYSGPISGSTEFCSTSDSSVANVITEVRKYANFTGMTVEVCYLDGNNSTPNRV